jgi:hypothetical protein
MVNESGAAHGDKDVLLAEDSPHLVLYRTAVPIWCHGKSADDLDLVLGEGYSCGFAVGFEQAIITGNLLPEWARGFYLRLRQYYLKSHTPADLLVWDDRAAETARAIPIKMEWP